jgi:type II secretory pathway component PulJ
MNGLRDHSVRSQRRSGITLTQLLVVISLTTTISGAAITSVISLLRQQGRVIQTSTTQQSWWRLSAAFRRDAHAARFAQIVRQNQEVSLIFRESPESSDSVTYSVAQDHVARRQSGAMARSEIYRIPGFEVTFRIQQKSNRDAGQTAQPGDEIHLIAHRATSLRDGRTSTTRLQETVIAMIGRDSRFKK